jgi:hypothetical protein
MVESYDVTFLVVIQPAQFKIKNIKVFSIGGNWLQLK